MPLVEGIKMSVAVPPESRPRMVPVLMGELLRAIPDGQPRARRGQDGTAWCLCCDVTVSPHPRAAFCQKHRTERNTVLRRRARQEGPSPQTTLQKDAIDQVVEAADNLMESLGRAAMEYPRLPAWASDWVNTLMLRTKELTRAVDSGLRPHSSYARPRAE